MNDLIKQVKPHYPQWNPPSNKYQLSGWNDHLQGSGFPQTGASLASKLDDVLALYRDHNGMPVTSEPHTWPSMRLMSYEEAIASQGGVRNALAMTQDQWLLWTDDNSNYMGIYVHEPLAGMVFLVKHDEPDLSPCFRSVSNLYEEFIEIAKHNTYKRNEKPRYWYDPDISFDFPKIEPDLEHDADDLAASQQYTQRYYSEKNEFRKTHLAYTAMNILPFAMREPLIMFAYQDDMYVSSRAIELLGLRQDAEAIPTIEMVIRTRPSNPRSAGIRALGQIGTEEAIKALIRVAHDLHNLPHGSGYAGSFLDAFQTVGYEIKRENNMYSYRPTSEDDWITFLQQE